MRRADGCIREQLPDRQQQLIPGQVRMERTNSLWRSLDLLDTSVLALALVENVVRDDEALDVPKADRAGRIVAVPAQPNEVCGLET